MRGSLIALVALLALSGCSVSRTAGHVDVARLVEQRTGQRTHWDQGSLEDAQVAEVVNKILQQDLTRERAIEIALVNNRSLQATYEDLDVSQAEMVQAGLLKNPSLTLGAGFPLNPGSILELEGSIVQDFLDLLVLPLRKKIAKERFTAAILRVANQAFQVAVDVSKQFVSVQVAQQFVDYRRTLVAAAQAMAELGTRLHEAGNINELTLAADRAAYEAAELERVRAEIALVDARERLNRLLGLWGPQTGWTITQPLPELPAADPPLEHLESVALRQRLDVDAARKEVALLGRAAALARDFRLFGRIEVGLQGHRDPDGPKVLGPTLTLELPIFDQRQAEIARLDALRRQAERRLAAVSVDARSEVRTARMQMLTARQIIERYRTKLLPLRGQIVELSQLQYNGMLLGPAQLFAAKQAQVDAYQQYVEALRDYWAGRAELERALGGRLAPPSLPAAPAAPAESSHNKDHEHEHATK